MDLRVVKNTKTKGNAISTDEQLVDAARSGDQKAFAELVRKYEARVAATVIGMLGNCSEADDVGQETFIRFYKALDSYRGDSSLATYLTRIAINLSLNELKRRKRRFSLFSRSATDDLPDVPDTKNGALPYEDRELVRWGLRKLQPEFRAVLVLRLLDGYSTEETAQILRVPLGTVLSRLARAQMKLRDILKPFYGDESCETT
ncbi:MAG: sigma-70 family RNA polymerase sigma factor [candidate division Zixibacteria bacterium]|nr:sigma-70 family RNA polymerase sigma factor [candidate division Zixibacteria bacterium]